MNESIGGIVDKENARLRFEDKILEKTSHLTEKEQKRYFNEYSPFSKRHAPSQYHNR
ncbi:hypothetical protein GOV10_01535 [Candidatus Woesearchaeota archaeon]|nr:hypothetical protein [Candidatus Woesearchaeota archaeon]